MGATKWPEVELGEVSSQVRGVTYKKSDAIDEPRSGYIGVLRAGNIQDGEIDFEDLVYVPRAKVKTMQSLQRDDVLIAASSGSLEVVGKAAQVAEDIDAGFGAFCKVMRPQSGIDPSYFGQCFKTPSYRSHINNVASGANINNLKNDDLNSFKIPLPPIEEQRRIAKILDAADSLRQQRKAAIAKLEALTQAIFIDMFGRPNHWTTQPLGELIQDVCYGTGSPPPYQVDGIPFLRATNVKNGTVLDRGMKYISEADAERLETCKVRFGDLIVVRSGVNAGECGLVPKRYSEACAAFDLIVTLDYDLAIFYNFFLNSTYGKSILRPVTRRAAQPHLNAKQLRSLIVPVPRAEDSKRFRSLVEAKDMAVVEATEGLAQLDTLFHSLQQRAFRGDL